MSGHESVRDLNAVDEAEWSEVERSAIFDECEFIVTHPAFRNSHRCVILLRYLVEHALDGDDQAIKERTLGVEVFGRLHSYDTNSDPIVRMTANEIRKRLAQCYEATQQRRPVRIRLVPGTYVPQFEICEHSLPQDDAEFLNDMPTLHLEREEPERIRKPNDQSKTRLRIVSALAALLTLVAVVVLVLVPVFPSMQTQIWQPILDAKQPVTICVGTFGAFGAYRQAATWAQQVNQVIRDHAIPQDSAPPLPFPEVSFVDAVATGRVSSWLSAHHKPSTVQPAQKLTLEELRKGPVVLIGEFDDPWSLILLSNLRYHVRVDPSTLDEWVIDAQAPSNLKWKGSGKLLYTDSSVDYAIVSRFFDPDIGQWVLAAGGLGMHGTESAVELITDPEYNKVFLDRPLTGKKNFQIVLRATVIGGEVGPPEIVAEYSW